MAVAALALSSSVGCGDDSSSAPSSDAGGTLDAGGGPTGEWAALVRGTLFTSDLAEAQSYHDMLAAGGRADAMAAGDFGHDPLLGTALLGTTENAFAAIDRWTNEEGMNAFYASPEFASAFGMLFASPPTLETFQRADDFHQWDDLDAADGTVPAYFVIVRGTLAQSDRASNQEAHDMVAMAGETRVRAAGDLAHVVYLGTEDQRQFLAVDVWGSSMNIEAVYGDPDFAAAFGSLFEGMPELGVYATTDWEGW